ncbi:MAG TPA: hypothetical protein VMF09_07225 [Solirubrobacteraceae bacterium]|nr:hypothetical protein [Solirubrobacteraceae bacterium]
MDALGEILQPPERAEKHSPHRAGDHKRRVSATCKAAGMTEAHIRVTNEPAGRLSVVPAEVRGDHESSAPALIVPVSVELFPRGGQTVVLDRLAATLWTHPPLGPRRRVGLPTVIHNGDARWGLLVSEEGRGNPHRVELRFDLLDHGLRTLDEHFQTNPAPHPELTMYLDARLGIAPNFPDDVNETGTLGLVQLAKPLTDELVVPIAREHWAREIAPALGHDRMRLVAVRLPSTEGPLGRDVVISYNDASHAYDRAEWRECIQKCRDVRTYVERAVRQEDGEHVAAAVARRLGTDKNDPRIKFLDSIWTALVNHTSGAHHIDSRDRLEAATAHAALLVTATMIQHVAELIGPA